MSHAGLSLAPAELGKGRPCKLSWPGSLRRGVVGFASRRGIGLRRERWRLAWQAGLHMFAIPGSFIGRNPSWCVFGRKTHASRNLIPDSTPSHHSPAPASIDSRSRDDPKQLPLPPPAVYNGPLVVQSCSRALQGREVGQKERRSVLRRP